MDYSKTVEILNGVSREDQDNDDDDGVFYRRMAKEMLGRQGRSRPVEPPPGPARDQKGRFLKGETGNRMGRKPRLKVAKSELPVFLNTLVDVTRNGKTEQITRKLAFKEKVFADAMNGRVTAMRMVADWVKEERDEHIQALAMLRELQQKHSHPFSDPWTPQELQWRDELIRMLTLGQDSTSRFRDMDHARSRRRRELKERRAEETAAAAEAEAREARRAARKAKAEAKKKPKPDDDGSEGGVPCLV